MTVSSVNGITRYQPPTPNTNLASGDTAMNMDDFFTLLTAQLSNQDMSNPVNDTEFISQMAQFSMIQALSDLNKMSQTAYSVSLVGKEATVASVGSDGSLQSSTGIVESVNLYNGEAEVVIGGTAYPISSVMEVSTPTVSVPNTADILDALQIGPQNTGINPLFLEDDEEAQLEGASESSEITE